MRTFFYSGLEPKNKRGVTTRFWRIALKGFTVRAEWGAAALSAGKGLRPGAVSRDKEWPHTSLALARADLNARIQEKLSKGYKPAPRRSR